MSEPEKAAHFVVYGITSEEILENMLEEDVGQLNVQLHDHLESHGLEPESVALVSGDRAQELMKYDRDLWSLSK